MSFDRFLLAVESRDLSQADKSNIRVSSFSNEWIEWIFFTIIQNKPIWHLEIWQNWCFDQFYHFSSVFSVFLVRGKFERIRAFILQNVQGSVAETEKKVLLPITQLGKEDTLIILLSAWDRPCDSTAKRNLSKHM